MTSEEFRNNPLFLRNQFSGDGVFQMPKIQKDEIDLENIALIGYDKLSDNDTDKIVHFFLDDYKFEVMWKDPEPRIERLKRYRAVLSPNFSLYTEMPLSLQVYNTFRSRWCGAYLQSMGISVIPTVSWGEPGSFWFCFDGIPKGSVVAVSTLGVRTEKSLFMQGYNELLRKIKPSAVICYGKPFDEMKGEIIEVDYAETNNYAKSLYGERPLSIGTSLFDSNKDTYVKKICAFIATDKGMGSAAGGGGDSGSRSLNEGSENGSGSHVNREELHHEFPDYPGNDPNLSPGKGYGWRGSGSPESGKGNWYNPETGESLYPDLNHPDPIDPHWDYKYPGGWERGYRIFPDGSIELKTFEAGDEV